MGAALSTLTFLDEEDQIVYHGTEYGNVDSILKNGFRPSANGMLGQGIYVSRDISKAKDYGEAVLKLKVRVGRVCIVTSQDDPDRKTWQSQGYDTAFVPPEVGMVKSEREEACVKSPDQIEVLGVMRFPGNRKKGRSCCCSLSSVPQRGLLASSIHQQNLSLGRTVQQSSVAVANSSGFQVSISSSTLETSGGGSHQSIVIMSSTRRRANNRN